VTSQLPAEFWDEVRRAWSTPGRAYHGPSHLDDVLARYDEQRWQRPLEALIALAWHDGVYVPGAADNEARSAALARRAVACWAPSADADRVARLIELTAAHGKLEPGDVDADEARVLDCDLAILGSAPDTFDRYDRGIAAEYAYLPPATFAAARMAFLERLLSRERIFLSDSMHARLDRAARKNLRRSLATFERRSTEERPRHLEKLHSR